jgi:CelD/BcsL family acetyltransferase involved in cellulose biosynthesis
LAVASHAKPLLPDSGKRRVVQLDASDPRWDSFVLAAPGATVFHHSGWLAALESEYGQRPLRLACEEPDGTLSGVLPLVVTRGLPLGIGGPSAARRLSSLPRTPIAGLLGTSDAAFGALVAAAMARARPAGLRLQLKQASRTLDDVVPGLQGTPWRLSYVKSLPDDPDLLRFGPSRKHARIACAVRKAQREGLRVRDAVTEADLREWYRLYLDVNRWRGVPSRPYRFFLAAWQHLRPSGFLRLLLVYRRQSGREVLLAGSMLLMLGDTTFYAFNGRLQEALHLRPNELLQWHAMRDAAAAGYRWYDFGEVGVGNEGLARFKAKWDTETRTLMRYHSPPLPACELEYSRPVGGTALGRIALGAWHRMPLSVTAFAGDQVYQFL